MTDFECDLLVVGSGAAGLSCAITAKKRGLNVVVIEKEPVFGGTTPVWRGALGAIESAWSKAKPARHAGCSSNLHDAGDGFVF